MGGDRNPYIDGLRFVAALAIVLQHSAVPWLGSSWVAALNGACHFGIPVFFLASGYLHPPDADGRWVRRRFVRIAIPYALWSALWLLIALATTGSVFGFSGGTSAWGLRVLFLGAAAPHLWFLPALFYVGAVTAPLRTTRARLVAAAVGVASWAVAYGLGAAGSFVPIGAYLALYLVGLEVARRGSGRLAPSLLVTCAALATLTAAVASAGIRVGTPLILMACSITGIALLLLAARGSIPLDRVAWGGPLLMGVYQVHFLLIRTASNLTPLPSIGPLLGVPALFVVVATLSVGISLLARRSRLLRPVFA